jgi:hypothetical protein
MDLRRSLNYVRHTFVRMLPGMLIASLGVLLNELLVAKAGAPRPDWAWPVSIGLLCVGALISGSWWALFLDPPAFGAGLVAADLWLSTHGRHALGWDLFDGDTLRQSLAGHGELILGLCTATLVSVALGKWLRGAGPSTAYD